ncbi:MAG: hypothetical protein AAGA54_23900 [Myxococcota bacterium]
MAPRTERDSTSLVNRSSAVAGSSTVKDCSKESNSAAVGYGPRYRRLDAPARTAAPASQFSSADPAPGGIAAGVSTGGMACGSAHVVWPQRATVASFHCTACAR